MYDPKKENDKEVLQEFTRHMHERIVELEIKVIQLVQKNAKDEEILEKLSQELKNLRDRVFNSKQERNANKPIDKKRKKGKLPHNQSKIKN